MVDVGPLVEEGAGDWEVGGEVLDFAGETTSFRGRLRGGFKSFFASSGCRLSLAALRSCFLLFVFNFKFMRSSMLGPSLHQKLVPFFSLRN